MTAASGNSGRQLAFAFPVALLVLATPLLLFAFELVPAIWRSGLGPLLSEASGYMAPATLSLTAATFSLALILVLSLGFASLALRSPFSGDTPSSRALCLGLGIAVVPFFLGSTSFAFLWSVPLDPLMRLPVIAERGPTSVILIEVLAQVLRYVPLLTWLLVIAGLEADGARVFYQRSSGFRTRDFIRDELGFKWSILCVVVGAFAFQDAANDYIITYLSLRPSPATETELISHFLQRKFTANTISRSADFAIETTLLGASAFGIASMAAFACLCVPIIHMRRISAFHYRRKRKVRGLAEYSVTRTGALVLLPIFLAVVFALALRLLHLNYEGWELARRLGFTAFLSLCAAGIAWSVAALLVFGVRNTAALGDGSAQRRLVLIVATALAIGFIPAIGIAVAVQSFLFKFIGNGPVAATMAWLMAQSIRLTPVLAIFMIPALLTLEDERVDYVRYLGVRFISRWRILFVGPFKTMHLALLTIAWGWVVNEGVISAVFQSDIPSFSELLMRATSGRSAAYPIAATLVALEGLVFASLCLSWSWRVYSGWRGRNAVVGT